jgi:hypothetical protein
VTGWIVIIIGGTTWEVLSLYDHAIPTLSHHVRVIMNPVVGRAGLVAVWLVIGYSLFGPGER